MKVLLTLQDVEPAVRLNAMLEREAPGISERIRAVCMDSFPRAALSRGVSGSRGRTLIVNLAGSPGGVRDGLAALDPIVEHAVRVLRGEITEHSRGQGGSTP